jgi:hypothetical protein
MAIGDISINTFTIGSVNINDASKVSLSSFDIYEDILDPYGPVGEVKMFDYNDTMSQANFNGGEDVTISFSTDNSESLTFNFKPLKSTNDDRSNVNSATGKNKLLDVHNTGDIIIVSFSLNVTFLNLRSIKSMKNYRKPRLLCPEKKVFF